MSDDELNRLLENPSSVNTIDDLPEKFRTQEILRRYGKDVHPRDILASEMRCQEERYDPSKNQGYKQPSF